MSVVNLERQGHVALITLNRPEALNAISPEVAVRAIRRSARACLGLP